MPTMIETDLKEVLGEIQKELKAIRSDLNDLKVSQAEIKGDFAASQAEVRGDLSAFHAEIRGDLSSLKVELALVKEDVKDLKGSQRTQIWVLIVAVVSAIIKFGFFPNS